MPNPQSETLIEINHLSKSFGSHEVLKDIHFHVNRGEVICIIGSSGSGKSTLLRCINLLERPDGGEIIYDGKNLDLMDKMVYFVNSSGNALDRNVKLKDVYSGKRCFIIGNGPSLKISDLEMIMNEVTMSCNSTIDLFEKTIHTTKKIKYN